MCIRDRLQACGGICSGQPAVLRGQTAPAAATGFGQMRELRALRAALSGGRHPAGRAG